MSFTTPEDGCISVSARRRLGLEARATLESGVLIPVSTFFFNVVSAHAVPDADRYTTAAARLQECKLCSVHIYDSTRFEEGPIDPKSPAKLRLLLEKDWIRTV